jgi:hypothetical protein
MYQLWVLGALDNTGALTPLGRKMVMCCCLVTLGAIGGHLVDVGETPPPPPTQAVHAVVPPPHTDCFSIVVVGGLPLGSCVVQDAYQGR